jgi:Flp pilus assembly protein TadD
MGTSVSTGRPEGQPAVPSGGPGPGTETPAGDEGSAWLTAARVGLLTVAAFLPVIACGWVNWDDDANFLENPQLRGLGWAQVAWAWRTTLLGVYQPLSWMMFEAEYSGWRLNPKGYHVVSLALHAVNAVAVFALFVALLRRSLPDLAASRPAVVRRSAALAAALWAVNPLRVEPVAWVSAQGYLPCTLCLVLAVLAYLRTHDPGRSLRGWLAWSAAALGLYAAAVLFKAVAVGLPAVLVVLDVYPLRRLGRGGGVGAWLGRPSWRVWAEKLPFAVLGLLFINTAAESRPTFEAGLGARLATAAYAVWFYPFKTAVPLWLSAAYAPCEGVTLSQPLFLAAALGAVGITAAVAWRGGRWPGLAAAWAAYLLILAPNAGLVRSIRSLAADRYAYVSTLALFALLAGGFCLLAVRAGASGRVRGSAARAGIVASAAVVLLGLGALDWFQAATWRSSVALWTHAVGQPNGAVYIAEINLGQALSEQGRLGEAEAASRRAIALRPDLFIGHHNLGIQLAKQGRYDEAVPCFLESIRVDPVNAQARNNLGMTFIRLGDLPRAEEQLREALRLRPDYPDAHNNLGTVLMMRGPRKKEAAEHFAEALRLRPGLAGVRHNLKEALSPDDPAPAGPGRPASPTPGRGPDRPAERRPS